MVADDLSVLPDELRKAAKTTDDIIALAESDSTCLYCQQNSVEGKGTADYVDACSSCVVTAKKLGCDVADLTLNRLWLPAGLAAKDRQKIKQELGYYAAWICFGCNSLWENHGDDAKCGNCGKKQELWVKFDKVEEAFR